MTKQQQQQIQLINQIKTKQSSSSNKQVNKDTNSPTESSSTSSSTNSTSLFSSYKRWSTSLDDLINDELGRKLFTEYLKEHHCDNILQFLTLVKCRETCKSDDDIKSLLNLAYTNFFLKKPIKVLSDGLRDKLSIALEQHRYDISLFDKAYKELNDCLISDYYPKFLQSKLYLNALKVFDNQVYMQNLLDLNEIDDQFKLLLKYINSFDSIIKSSSSTSSNSKRSTSAGKINRFVIPSIPTSSSNATNNNNNKSLNYPTTPSTKSGNKLSKLNESTLSSKSHKLSNKLPPNPYSVIGKVIPVSAQDSEIQSQLSTDDDNKSRTRSSHQHRYKQMQQSIQLNKNIDTSMPLVQMPRTMTEEAYKRDDKIKPDEFVRLLNSKLESLELDSQRRCKLFNSLSFKNDNINRTLHDYDSDTERLIDEHVNRVFKSTHDLTQLSFHNNQTTLSFHNQQAPLNNTVNQSINKHLNKSVGSFYYHKSTNSTKEVDIDDKQTQEYAKRKSMYHNHHHHHNKSALRTVNDECIDSGVSSRSVSSIERVNDWLTGSTHSVKQTTTTLEQQATPKLTNHSDIKTTVAYYLPGEEVAYITQFNGDNLTLSQFKSLLTKRGPFRFFFKTKSDLLDEECIAFHEVSDDSSLLPKFNGKVICKLEHK